jgi:uncharacterized protein (DUF885 family)
MRLHPPRVSPSAISLAFPAFADPRQDAEFEKVADEYIKGWLAAHPITATQLGIHDFDGRIGDFTRLALDAELSRLKRFDERLKRFDAAKLSAAKAADLRILHAAIRKDLFEFQAANTFENNPMVYAQAIDVNVYIKRNFAPLEERVRSIITIENQVPNIVIAAKTNLAQVLPRPFVELAIQIARGNCDFLKSDLVEALKDLKDERLRSAFSASNRKAWMALSDYANWLERDRLPKAIAEWPLGEQKYRQMLAETELLNMEPAKVLEIGMAELQREQASFEAAAKIIDPSRPAHEVFKDVKKDHPTSESLIPDTAENA